MADENHMKAEAEDIGKRRTELNDFYYKGCYLDARDSVNEWRVA